MSIALEDVELEVGRTYQCELRGHQIEVRVLSKPETSSCLSAEDVMLDPWCELPSPKTIGVLSSSLVEHLPFDIPEIPVTEETT